MYTVIDTINCRGWIKRYPQWLEKGEGLLVILDPSQISERPDIPNNRVKILRPDNTTFELTVAEVEVNHNIVALFFKDAFPEKIPRLSTILWA